MAIRILCAGKNDDLAEFVKSAVAEFECEVVKSTSVALAMFLAQKNFPSLILCEQKLVEGTGQELYNAVQEESTLNQIPFFIVTEDVWQSTSSDDSGALTLRYPKHAEDLRDWLKPYLVEIPDLRPEETPE
ncbi:MAG: hypothetical protein K2W95_21460 [Candidatus Obscuribacterales bacterium]|nr:hypothetical protein [Candidatus Obscuribacterales bacterium]